MPVTASAKSFTCRQIPDEDPDTSYLEQEGFETRRKEYGLGYFGYVGVRAEIDLQVPYGQDYIIVPVKTPGIWSIEDDDDEGIKQAYRSEVDVLKHILRELGVTVVD
jgi:hypothetical protein